MLCNLLYILQAYSSSPIKPIPAIIDEVILGSIAWSFASIFRDFCIPQSRVDISGVWIVIGNSGRKFIDTETSSKFLDFCFTSYELNHSDEKVVEIVEILEDLEHLSEHFDFSKGGKNYE